MVCKHLVVLVMCVLCLTSQSGCNPLKALVGIVKAVASSGVDDVLRAGSIKGAATVGDDLAKTTGTKAAESGKNAVKRVVKSAAKRLKEAMESAETNTTQAQASLIREGPHAATRAMHFLCIRYGQNVDALNEEFSRISDDMGEHESAAAQKRIGRIAREQAAIAALAERMK